MASNSFSIDLREFCAKAKGKIDEVARTAVVDVGNKLVQRTPVGDATLWKSPPPPGYVGGQAKGSWVYGLNEAPQDNPATIDATGAASNSRISAGVAASPAAAVHFIGNNVPYAVRLENGWSTQAPSGMVELTALEWTGIVSDAVERMPAVFSSGRSANK